MGISIGMGMGTDKREGMCLGMCMDMCTGM